MSCGISFIGLIWSLKLFFGIKMLKKSFSRVFWLLGNKKVKVRHVMLHIIYWVNLVTKTVFGIKKSWKSRTRNSSNTNHPVTPHPTPPHRPTPSLLLNLRSKKLSFYVSFVQRMLLQLKLREIWKNVCAQTCSALNFGSKESLFGVLPSTRRREAGGFLGAFCRKNASIA